ncbi:unnamed protein product [Coccothraustes coccothraustes]
MQSTMADQGFSCLLQFYLLLLLIHLLNPSSSPERDMGTLGLLPKELELQDMDPEPTPSGRQGTGVLDMHPGGAADHGHCPGMVPWQKALETPEKDEGGGQAAGS